MGQEIKGAGMMANRKVRLLHTIVIRLAFVSISTSRPAIITFHADFCAELCGREIRLRSSCESISGLIVDMVASKTTIWVSHLREKSQSCIWKQGRRLSHITLMGDIIMPALLSYVTNSYF